MSRPLTTTLNRIRAHGPCQDGWEELLKGLNKMKADDEPLPYATIAEINGIDDALWCCRAEPQYHKKWRLFAVWCARQVQHLMPDERSVNALDVAERYANGTASDEELTAARVAAWDAIWDITVGTGTAWADTWAAARASAMVVAWDAARDATKAAAWAAIGSAARDATRNTTGDAIKSKFIEMVTQ